MNVRSDKARRQRQAMIEDAIRLGAFDDRRHVKSWMKAEFKLKEPVEEISTEYTLNDNQMKLFYIWLRYFTGRGKKPRVHRSRSRAGGRRLWRINELCKALGWSQSTLADFIARQIGKRKLPASLTASEASTVISGMDRILAEQPFKSQRELNLEKQ